MVKAISVLGCTGSIGRQTLAAAEHIGVRVAALTAQRKIDLLERAGRQSLQDRRGRHRHPRRRRDGGASGGGDARGERLRGDRGLRRGGAEADPRGDRGEEAHRPGQQGDPGLRGRARHARGEGAGRGDRARGLRALGHLPVPDGEKARRAAQDPADRLRRPLPRQAAVRARVRHARAGGRPPQLEHGREDLRRQRDDDEQGPRIRRGHAPVRRHPRRHHGGHPPAERDPPTGP